VILLILLLKKQQNKSLFVLFSIYLYVITVPLSSKLLIRLWSVEDSVTYTQTYDAVVALSGMANANWYLGRESSPLPLNCYYRFGQNADRIIKAAEILKTGHAGKLLFGDLKNKSFSEAQLVKDFLSKQGISSEQIAIYGEVRNTLDEAVKTRQYVEITGLKKLLLVTSENHMRRARAMFNRQGLYPDLLSVSKINKKIECLDFIPCKNGLSNMQGILYEIAGHVYYFVTAMFLNMPF
jgi:uncharacterized SAM-binding protein YcdF (DUF218 family)